MPTATARRLCPDLIVLPVRMSHYAAISRQILEIFFRYTPLVEPLALDEAFLDVSGCRSLFGPPDQIARSIRGDILRETGLVASVGVAPNKFLAKIASDLEKPDALVVVDPAGINEFLDPLPIGRLWGVGKITEAAMRQLGVTTIGQLRRVPLEHLKHRFGESGEQFWRLARGIDDRPVVPDRQAKSLSHETTFARDLTEIESLRYHLWELTGQVTRRLRRTGRCGRTVQLKLRFANFRTITRSRTLPAPSDVTDQWWAAASELLDHALPPDALASGVRLIGMGISGLAAPAAVQKTLFDDQPAKVQTKQRHLDRLTDAVQARFGDTALQRGRAVIAVDPDAPAERPPAPSRTRLP